MKVAIQGEPGSFHHIAAKRWFGDEATYYCGKTFANVFEALTDSRADQAVIAIENSNHGSITSVYGLLTQYRFQIVGEISERIHQNLVGLPEAELEKVTTVYSHAVALSQSSDFLDDYLPDAKRIEFYDTAGAVELIKEQNKPGHVAIASHLAAEIVGLPILKDNIENSEQNYTRFLVIDPKGVPPEAANKASLVIETPHKAGSLHAALGVFAAGDHSITKLESRPVPAKVWKYQFYIDVEVAGTELRSAIDALEKQGCDVILLGEYVADITEYEDD
jgi:prephenate dehydratase